MMNKVWWPEIFVWAANVLLIVVYVNLFYAQMDWPRPGPQPSQSLSGELELRGNVSSNPK